MGLDASADSEREGLRLAESSPLSRMSFSQSSIREELLSGHSLAEQALVRDRLERAKSLTSGSKLNLPLPSEAVRSKVREPEFRDLLGLVDAPSGARFVDFANQLSVVSGRVRLLLDAWDGESMKIAAQREFEEARESLNSYLKRFPFLYERVLNVLEHHDLRMGLELSPVQRLEYTAAIMETLNPTAVTQLDLLTKTLRMTEVPSPIEYYGEFQSSLVFLGIAVMMGHLSTSAQTSQDATNTLFSSLGLHGLNRASEVA
ncbi:MAG: hypothetical protein KDD64_02145 [Bdellovibrionales bacterium]|nr:hypothetical protein [Bdellovibrionales bacterium]